MLESIRDDDVGSIRECFQDLALPRNLWVVNNSRVTSGLQLRLDRGGPPLAPLPSHQPSTAGRRADARATAEGLVNSSVVYKWTCVTHLVVSLEIRYSDREPHENPENTAGIG